MQNAILSAKALIEKRKLIEDKKRKEFLIEVQDLGAFRFRTPDFFDIVDSQAFKDGENADDYIIYTCAVEPSLKNRELQEAFECHEPFDIVDKLFLPGEKQRIASLLSEMAGYKKDVAKVVEEVKN